VKTIVKPFFQRRNQSAFSLIEVVIAFGIVTFAVLICVGLNTVSVSSLGDSKIEDISTRIFRGVLSEAQSTDFDDLAVLIRTNYYDFEGTYLSTSPTNSAVYVAVISMTNGSSFISGSTMGTTGTNTCQLTVNVYRSGLISSNTLVTSRSLLLGNRQKGL